MARISLNNVSVAYPIYNQRNLSLRANLVYYGTGGILARDAAGRVVVKALNGISLQAERGDRIGLIGRNGAGKSTLLKVLAGIYKPTAGTVQTEGRISAILGMGLGVDEELSGYDAIEYACLLRGIPRTEVKRLKAEISAFTELGDYLELPIGTYSSGMRVRLAFAVATAYTPDILLLDEGIGAGDTFFLEKAKTRADSFIGKANLLFLASHSEMMLRSMCNKAILLDHGHILAAGAVDDVMTMYRDLEKPVGTGVVISANVMDTKTVAPISSASRFGFSAKNAFDGSATTHWHSEPNPLDSDRTYIGLDFAEPIIIRQVVLRQWSNRLSGGPFMIRAEIRCGNDPDFEDMTCVTTIDLDASVAVQRFGIDKEHMARFWCVVALESAPGNTEGWALTEVDFHSAAWGSLHFGQAIASGAAAEGVAAANAFHRHLPAPWVSKERAAGVVDKAWIGWDYGPNRRVAVQKIKLQQWDDGARPNTISRVKIQCSNDEFKTNIQTVRTIDISQTAAAVTYAVDSELRRRYWRILADSPTDGGHWGVSFIDFIES